MSIQLIAFTHGMLYFNSDLLCVATLTVGSSACGLWQGVCTYPLYSGLVVTFSNKHSESTICADTVQTSTMTKKGMLLREVLS